MEDLKANQIQVTLEYKLEAYQTPNDFIKTLHSLGVIHDFRIDGEALSEDAGFFIIEGK